MLFGQFGNVEDAEIIYNNDKRSKASVLYAIDHNQLDIEANVVEGFRKSELRYSEEQVYIKV